MSLLRRAQRDIGDPGNPLIPNRANRKVGSVNVTADSAMQMSAVWAALRLRADLISTIPFGVWRTMAGKSTVMDDVPQVLQTPGWNGQSIMEWLYASQVDLDRYGNTFGLITQRDKGTNLPTRVELQAGASVRVDMKDGNLRYTFGKTVYQGDDLKDVWHERAYVQAGSLIGLSPVSSAANTIGRYLSADDAAADWFASGGVPKGHLKNTQRNISPKEAGVAKGRFSRIFEDGGVFVSGSDWEYSPIQSEQNDTFFLQSMAASTTDVARFFGVPGDLIDAPNQGSSLTYANIGQRNLQFLIMHLGPALRRREDTLSRNLLGSRQSLKFDAAAVLLQMDPQTAATVNAQKIAAKYLTPNEQRAIEGRPPLTLAEYIENNRLFPPRGAAWDAYDKLVLPAASAPAAAPPKDAGGVTNDQSS